MKTILHITFSAITDYLGEGLQIEESLQNGFVVKILEINTLFKFSPPEHSLKFSNLVIKIDSFEQLEQMLLSHNPNMTIVNVQMVYEWRFRKIFRLMSKYRDYKYTLFLLGQLPFRSNSSLRKKIAKASFSKIINKAKTVLFSKILFKIHYLSHQDVMFYAGESISINQPYKFQFPVNYFDYDQYLKNPQTSDENYILFLDDALFNHPDDEIIGNFTTAQLREEYKTELKNFFDRIEVESGKKVIIASHPKVNHARDSFGERDIIRFKTRELVQKSSLVLAHFSSSISYAVCYEKPIYFLTSDLIIQYSKSNHPIADYIDSLANELKSPVININKITNLKCLDFTAIQTQYKKFQLNYLTTTATKNILSEKLILEYFERIFELKKQ